MSSVVENRSLLSGQVVSREPHPSVARWDLLGVQVTAVEPLAGWPDLLTQYVGQQTELVANRDELPVGDLVGWSFRGPVRLAGPGVVEALPTAAGAGAPELTPPG